MLSPYYDLSPLFFCHLRLEMIRSGCMPVCLLSMVMVAHTAGQHLDDDHEWCNKAVINKAKSTVRSHPFHHRTSCKPRSFHHCNSRVSESGCFAPLLNSCPYITLYTPARHHFQLETPSASQVKSAAKVSDVAGILALVEAVRAPPPCAAC